MNWVRIKADGTKITTPRWVIIPCALLGWSSAAAVCWVVLLEHGARQIGLLFAIVCLTTAAVIALHRFEKRERPGRSVFGGARFARERSEAERAGLTGD